MKGIEFKVTVKGDSLTETDVEITKNEVKQEHMILVGGKLLQEVYFEMMKNSDCKCGACNIKIGYLLGEQMIAAIHEAVEMQQLADSVKNDLKN